MKYKLIGIRPNHAQMRCMVGKNLFVINGGWVEKVYITDIKIGSNDKLEFVISSETPLNYTPLFVSMKSAMRYAKKHKIMLNYKPTKQTPY